MGGRKGYSLSKVVGDLRKVKTLQKELLEGVKGKDPKVVAKATTKILAKSSKALESIGHAFLFVDSISDEYEKLGKRKTKARRKEVSKKWASYRKEKGKKFDPAINRDVVDSTTRALGRKK